MLDLVYISKEEVTIGLTVKGKISKTWTYDLQVLWSSRLEEIVLLYETLMQGRFNHEPNISSIRGFVKEELEKRV